MSDRGPPSAVAERWRELLDDVETLADEYREAGWETLAVSTGDVTPRTGEPFGLDVVAPPEEFDTLRDIVEDATFDTSHVYRDEESDVRFFIVVQEASGDDVAVLVPAFCALDETDELLSTVRREETMYTHVRTLSGDERVTFVHDDPDLFF